MSELEDAKRMDLNQRSAGTKKQFFRRKKICPFSGANGLPIDYKDVKTLSRFISERGKIIPSRVTGVSHRKQRDLAKAIRRARYLSLMPYVNL
jgi:small subunit ribosomal protein S18